MFPLNIYTRSIPVHFLLQTLTLEDTSVSMSPPNTVYDTCVPASSLNTLQDARITGSPANTRGHCGINVSSIHLRTEHWCFDVSSEHAVCI